MGAEPLLCAVAGDALVRQKLAATDDKRLAKRIYQHLRETRNDAAETYVREAAERALAAI